MYGTDNGFGNVGRKVFDTICDGLKMPGTTRALLRGLIMPFSRGCVMRDVPALDNNDKAGTLPPRMLPIQLTTVMADWLTADPPSGRNWCDSKGIFDSGKLNGREFLATWGIPTPVDANWSGALVLPTNRNGCEIIGIFGIDECNGSKLPVMFGFRLGIDLADWSELTAPPTGCRRCGSREIPGCKLPAAWGIPTAAATVVGADVLRD